MLYYFDIGSWIGIIAGAIIDELDLLECEFKAYLFEPFPEHFDKLKLKFDGNENIEILNCAVSDTNTKRPLYLANGCGHSLHSCKNNVTSCFEFVDCIRFSDWYSTNINKSDKDFCLLRVDIEGSEYEFYKDIIETSINKEIDLFTGSINDVFKLGYSGDRIDDFITYLANNKCYPISINSFDLSGVTIIKEAVKTWQEKTQ